MNRFLLILFLLVIQEYVYSQKTEIGIIYSPILVSKLTFDKDYIIFKDYGSLTAGDNKFHAYFTGISTGLFFRYKIRNFYLQAETNFFGNNFGQQIPDWASSRKKNFTYSSIDVPVICGYTINPSSMIRFRIYGGLNNKFGKFITAFYSSMVYLINDNMNQEYYFVDKTRKKELINKLHFYSLNVLGGIGISRYSTSIDIRIERNITNLNKINYENNANFKDLFLIRLCLSHTLPYKTKTFIIK